MTCRVKTLSVLILFSLFAFAIPAVADTINGCVDKNGGLRVVLAGQPCKNPEFAISWNSVGPQGLPGVNGTNGAKGDTGVQGPAGAWAYEIVMGSLARFLSRAAQVIVSLPLSMPWPTMML